MSAKPSSDKAGEPSTVHCPSGSGAASSVTDTSPPAKRAKIADFATALMRACSVELPPGEREDRISNGEEESARADAKDGEGGMECGVFPGSPIFKKLGKMPTEKIINDWYVDLTFCALPKNVAKLLCTLLHHSLCGSLFSAFMGP